MDHEHTPDAVITGYIGIIGTQFFIGVAWSLEQAANIFYTYEKVNMVLCVSVPKCTYVNNVSEAKRFFDEVANDQTSL